MGVMLLLVQNVVANFVQMRGRNGECAIASLPSKVLRQDDFVIYQVGRRAFNFADQLRNRNRRREPQNEMNMIEVAARRNNDGTQFLGFVSKDAMKPVFPMRI